MVVQKQLQRLEKLKSDVGVKLDAGKPMMGLLPSAAITEVAKVLTFGASKYTAHNWRGGFKYSRLYDASLRHMHAYIDGEDKDPESGLSHLSHATCCLLMLIEHDLKGYGDDDRFKG